MPPETEITERAFLSWVRALGLFRQEMETYFHSRGLSCAQWGVLRTLDRAEAETGVAGLPLGELGRRMLVKPPSVSGVVDRLERQKLVERTASLTDLRSKEVRLTKTGRALLASVLKTHQLQREKILGVYTPAELASFQKLISKLETHLDVLVANDSAPLKK
jgi:DNA-binding MarR family transcriptional regulator